jgi:hypothetical protein
VEASARVPSLFKSWQHELVISNGSCEEDGVFIDLQIVAGSYQEMLICAFLS